MIGVCKYCNRRTYRGRDICYVCKPKLGLVKKVTAAGERIKKGKKVQQFIMTDTDERKNASGYPDPTAFAAITNADADERKSTDVEAERFYKLLHTIFNLCDLAGFRLEGRIVLVDKASGRVWR